MAGGFRSGCDALLPKVAAARRGAAAYAKEIRSEVSIESAPQITALHAAVSASRVRAGDD
jgi:hypothetical protein